MASSPSRSVRAQPPSRPKASNASMKKLTFIRTPEQTRIRKTPTHWYYKTPASPFRARASKVHADRQSMALTPPECRRTQVECFRELRDPGEKSHPISHSRNTLSL